MKVLHTADWHIGKILHKHSLREDIELYFDWLYDYVVDNEVDVLLVSGDVFDFANPSVSDRQLYYRFITKLHQANIKIVITGGNHDSVAQLEAPRTVLEYLSVFVVGGAKQPIERELVEIKDESGNLELVVAAVPFLRDADLWTLEAKEKYNNKTEAIREGVKEHYQRLAEICEQKYPNLPVIAMGHLYARGSTLSDSERDIHVGNAAAIESSIFSPTFDYVALGHIHRPQVIGGNEHIRYSGSPIALSFSEKNDKKKMILLDVKVKGDITMEQVDIPKFRELKRLKGTLTEIEESLRTYEHTYPLPTLFELQIQEAVFSSEVVQKSEELLSRETENLVIVKKEIHFDKGGNSIEGLLELGKNIEDLIPMDVFNTRLESEPMEGSTIDELRAAFLEILEIVESES